METERAIMHATTSHFSGSDSNDRKRKRGRTGYSCFECRRRKVKCDNIVPCTNCISRGDAADCKGPSRATSPPAVTFHDLVSSSELAGQFRPASVNSLKHVTDRLDNLEGELHTKFRALQTILIDHGLDVSSIFGSEVLEDASVPAANGEPEAKANKVHATEDALDVLETAAFTDRQMSSWNLNALSKSRAVTPGPADTNGPAQHVPSGGIEWPSIIDTRDSYRLWDTFLGHQDFLQRKLQDSLILNVPQPYVMTAILTYFWNSVDHMWHVVHRPTFQAEVQQLQVYLWSNTPMPAVDPAWFALLFALLGFASSRMAKDRRLREMLGWDDATAKAHQEQMFASCRMALTAADWIHTPSVRVLQAMLFLCAFEPHRGSLFGSTIMFGGRESRLQHAYGENPNAFHHWLSCAIRLGRQLGIDQLGESDDSMPSNDPGWPQGRSSLKRQLGIRLWYFLVILDVKASSPTPVIDRESYSTPLPTRCRDEDLGLDVDFTICPDSACSDVDHLIYQYYMTDHLAKVERLLAKSGFLQPAAVADLDRQLQAATRHVTGTDYGIIPTASSPTTPDFSHRINLSASLSYRLLRLHRPAFLSALRGSANVAPNPESIQGAQDSARDSVLVCLDRARAIIQVYAWPNLRGQDMMWWWFPAHNYKYRAIQAAASQADPDLLLKARRTLEEAAAYSDGAIGLAMRRSAHIIAALSAAEDSWLAAGAIEPLHELIVRVLGTATDTLPTSSISPFNETTLNLAQNPSTQNQGSQWWSSDTMNAGTSDLDAIIRSTLDFPLQESSISELTFPDDFSSYLTDLISQPTPDNVLQGHPSGLV